jgi:hypothetical protein
MYSSFLRQNVDFGLVDYDAPTGLVGIRSTDFSEEHIAYVSYPEYGRDTFLHGAYGVDKASLNVLKNNIRKLLSALTQ